MLKLNFINLRLVKDSGILKFTCLRKINKSVNLNLFEGDTSSRLAHLATIEYRGTGICISASFHKSEPKNIFIQHTQGNVIKSIYFSANGESLRQLSSLINTYIERSFGG